MITNQKRRYLTPDEAERLIKAAGQAGRQGTRDRALCLLAYRHGLRCSEAVALQWHQVDYHAGVLHVHRLKHGTPSVHPLRGPELRALREVRRQWPSGEYIFQSERGGPLSHDMAARVVERAGQAAGIDFRVTPHMLRHACGYKLANDGQDTRGIQHYLGHRNIQSTVLYTQLAPDRFREFWAD